MKIKSKTIERSVNIFIICVLTFVMTCSCNESISDTKGKLYFISKGSLDYYSWTPPYVSRIYKLSEDGKSLDSIWGSGITNIENVRVYSSSNIVLVTKGGPPPDAAVALSTKSVSSISNFDFSPFGVVTSLKYYQTSDSFGQIAVNSTENIFIAKPTIESRRIDVDQTTNHKTAANENIRGELRLAGIRSPYGDGDDDIISFSDIRSIPVKSNYSTEEFDGFPVPDSIIKMKTSKWWNFIANEPLFRALESVPDKNGLKTIELLIFNRNNHTWLSIEIPGNETYLQLINGKLTGAISDSNPLSDWKKQYVGEPILREEWVIVDPLNGKLNQIHIGKKAEILWIENDTVWYRVQDSLYKTLINDNDSGERTFLVKNPCVFQIHWAFRGGVGK